MHLLCELSFSFNTAFDVPNGEPLGSAVRSAHDPPEWQAYKLFYTPYALHT